MHRERTWALTLSSGQRREIRVTSMAIAGRAIAGQWSRSALLETVQSPFRQHRELRHASNSRGPLGNRPVTRTAEKAFIVPHTPAAMLTSAAPMVGK